VCSDRDCDRFGSHIMPLHYGTRLARKSEDSSHVREKRGQSWCYAVWGWGIDRDRDRDREKERFGICGENSAFIFRITMGPEEHTGKRRYSADFYIFVGKIRRKIFSRAHRATRARRLKASARIILYIYRIYTHICIPKNTYRYSTYMCTEDSPRYKYIYLKIYTTYGGSRGKTIFQIWRNVKMWNFVCDCVWAGHEKLQ